MMIEQPLLAYRLLFPEAIWRLKQKHKKTAYLTFDDGPIPEATPKVLDILARYGVKATFFMVGDNVRRYPELFDRIRREGHSYGNHLMHHLQGIRTSCLKYMRDLCEADSLIDSPLFRPPHGILRLSQAKAIRQHYNIVMYDVVTRDYSRRVSAEKVFENVRRYARNGSIIVFHDSLKSTDKLDYALPRSIEWLLDEGFELLPLPM